MVIDTREMGKYRLARNRPVFADLYSSYTHTRLFRCSLTAAKRSAFSARRLTLKMLQIAYYDINPATIRCDDLGYAATSGPQTAFVICTQRGESQREHCVPMLFYFFWNLI